MTNQTLNLLAGRCAALALCALTLPALAQTRAGGGGAGGGGGFGGGGAGGGAGRTSAASTATTASIDRPGNGQVGSANFYVDKDTGQVFVIADDQTTEYVKEVVASLAKPKPQVLIKVVFLEVDYNKGLDVGVEGTVTKHINASTSNTVSSLFNLAPPNNNGTVAGTTALSTLPGAGIYTIVGDDFSASLRAIETVGNVQILSRPTILARNNQMATIQVGYNYPLPTGVIAATTTAGPQTIITYTPVGIILNVTPNITSDGNVEMIVAPSISSVDSSISQVIGSTTNGGNISAPAIQIESANTVVVTPDGQTVVIGGLMQNNKTTTDNKIPLLGDIPGLGQLFHHKVSSMTKQELIILMTPYVVRTPTDLARMSQDERGRTKMAPKAFTQPELNQYLEPGEPKAPPPAPVSPLAKPPGPR